MASNKQFIFFFIVSPLILFISPISCSESDNVTVSVYYETLCPYCADFIVNHLVNLFQKGLDSIVNLRMIPWGNALMQPDGNFVCQHGPDECLLNTIEACTITIYPDADRHFDFIHCVEGLTLEKRESEWVNCFDLSGLGRVPIDCYRTGYGKLLEQRYAFETAVLNPPHRFVPWVVVNNQPLQQDFMNFVSYVCNAYKGARVPEACRSLPSRINGVIEKADINNNSVCYAGHVKNKHH